MLSPAALDFRTVWPRFLLQAAREGDEMADVGVPCQSLSPRGTTRARAGGGCWWGQKHDPCFLVDEDSGDGLLPWQEGLGGEEVRLETSGRATIPPGVLWLPQLPRCSLATSCRGGRWFLGGIYPGLGGLLFNKWNENQQKPCRNVGPLFFLEERPLPTPPSPAHGEDEDGPAMTPRC